jgi:hypothetical protein
MKQTQAYVLDLNKTDGRGDFSCPRCGNEISPDDTTEKAYSILESIVSNHGLEEIIIRCKKCESELHLTGFSLLQKLSLHLWPLEGGGKPCKNPFKKIEMKKHKNLTGNAQKNRMLLLEPMLITFRKQTWTRIHEQERTQINAKKRELTRWNGRFWRLVRFSAVLRR